jgi:hypothetical protein
VRRLVTQGALVEEVTDEAEAEDGRSKGVACCLAVATENASEELGAVFCGDVRDWLVTGSACVCEPLRATMLGKHVSNRTRSQFSSFGNLLPESRVEGNGSGRDCFGAVSKLRLGDLARFRRRCNVPKRLCLLKSTNSSASLRDVGRDMAIDVGEQTICKAQGSREMAW